MMSCVRRPSPVLVKDRQPAVEIHFPFPKTVVRCHSTWKLCQVKMVLRSLNHLFVSFRKILDWSPDFYLDIHKKVSSDLNHICPCFFSCNYVDIGLFSALLMQELPICIVQEIIQLTVKKATMCESCWIRVSPVGSVLQINKYAFSQ